MNKEQIEAAIVTVKTIYLALAKERKKLVNASAARSLQIDLRKAEEERDRLTKEVERLRDALSQCHDIALEKFPVPSNSDEKRAHAVQCNNRIAVVSKDAISNTRQHTARGEERRIFAAETWKSHLTGKT